MTQSDNWIWRELPESFFLEAGHHTKEEIPLLFKEIPSEFRPLAYTLIESAESVHDTELGTCIGFRHFIYRIYRDLIEKDNIDIHLPHYWYMDGVMIEPHIIVRITNGIIGWECDKSSENCGLTEECQYYKRANV